jgi:hypothetical protein
MPPLLDHTNKMKCKGLVSIIKVFLQSCVKVLNDSSSMKMLQNILEKFIMEMEEKLEPKTVNHLYTRRRTSREFRLNANIRDFNMEDIILDLGSEQCTTKEDMAMHRRANIRIFTCSIETGKPTQSPIDR